MVIDNNDVQRLDSPVLGLKNNVDAKWWESSDGHRFAGEVLQLRIRHKIMKFIGLGVKTREEIALAFGMKEHISELHLALLEKVEMIEQTDLGYRSTAIGTAYLKNFEAFDEMFEDQLIDIKSAFEIGHTINSRQTESLG